MIIKQPIISNGRLERFVVFYLYGSAVWIHSSWALEKEAKEEALKVKASLADPNEVYIMEVNHKVVSKPSPTWEVREI